MLKALRYPLDLWQSTADVQGDEYHIVLTLARIWYTLSTGRFTSKDAAADWLLPQLPEDYAATLRAAQREYLGLEQQDWHICCLRSYALWILPKRTSPRSSHKMPQDVCQVAQTAFLNYYLIGSHR